MELNNFLQVIALNDNRFRTQVEENTGHKIDYTFYSDLLIAELIGGEDAIRETHSRILPEWGSQLDAIVAYCFALNYLSFERYDQGKQYASGVYGELYYNAVDYAYSHLNEEEQAEFYRITD